MSARATVGGEGVGGAADVGAGEDLAIELFGGQLLERQLQNREVIGGGVGAGVAGTKQPGERLAGLVEVAEQGVKAKGALVGAGGALLLGVRGEDRRVDVEGDRRGPGAGLPSSRPGGGAGRADCIEQTGVDRLHHPVGGALGGDAPEQHLLPAQHPEV